MPEGFRSLERFAQKNMAVIEVTANAAFDLARRFGFTVDFGDDKMLALQAAIYDVFGKEIEAGELQEPEVSPPVVGFG